MNHSWQDVAFALGRPSPAVFMPGVRFQCSTCGTERRKVHHADAHGELQSEHEWMYLVGRKLVSRAPGCRS